MEIKMHELKTTRQNKNVQQCDCGVVNLSPFVHIYTRKAMTRIHALIFW